MQIDVPEEIYNNPVNTFVAKVIGQPEINLLDLEINQNNEVYSLVDKNIRINLSKRFNRIFEKYNKNKVIFGCRPQFWKYSRNDGKDYFKSIVQAFEIRNYNGIIQTKSNEGQISVLCDASEKIKKRETLWIKPDTEKFHIFDIESGENLALKNI